MSDKIRIAIFGGSGYGGSELLRILLMHPNADIRLVTANEHAGKRVGDVAFPGDTVLVGIIREDHPIAPSRDDSLEPHDELLFISTPDAEDELEAMLSPSNRMPRHAE